MTAGRGQPNWKQTARAWLDGRLRASAHAGRDLAWRALGEAPWAAQARAHQGPNPGKPANPWRNLRRRGLRVEAGLRILGAKPRIRVQFEAPAQLNNTGLQIYQDVRIGRYSYFRSGIVRYLDSIGRYSSVGPGVILGEAEHPVDWLSTSPAAFFAGRYAFYPPEADAAARVTRRTADNTDEAAWGTVTIGHDVWIGANVMVRRGVTIGDGAIVGSGAFVNRDVAPYTIVGGLPAKVIGQRFDDETVQRLQRIKWWEFEINDLAAVDFSDVTGALDAIERMEAAGEIRRVPWQWSSVELRHDGYGRLKVHPDQRENEKRRRAQLESD